MENNSQELTTIEREVLHDGNIRLTSIYGVMDTRNGAIYSEVVCKPKLEHFFFFFLHEEAEEE